MLANLQITAMQPGDLVFAAECTDMEGWVSENYAQFEIFYQHDPQGCFIARLEGNPAGICVATSYTQNGFIGELIVKEEYRQCGIGQALLKHAVAYLQKSGASTVYLDGVVAAIPLYERNGFRKICRSSRFSGHLSGKLSASVRPMLAGDLPEVCHLDRQAFGDDRSFFLSSRLEHFSDLCKVLVEEGRIRGYICGRSGEGYVAGGPWVIANENIDPMPLLESLVCEARESILSIGVLESNTRAIALVRSLGLAERVDNPWRMAFGLGDDLGRSPECLGVGSAAKG